MTGLKDYYEILQVSPRADRDMIERVYRYLAHRFHPDNRETGDAERFTEIVDAYERWDARESKVEAAQPQRPNHSKPRH